jgi:ribosomal-protein-alanine N-acetyltransferase
MGSEFEAAMDEVTLREYKPGDWEAMYALDLACFEPAFRFSRGVMRGFAEAPGAIAVLAEAEGALFGFCVVQMEGHVGYVVTLDVASAWRRQGLARRMMEDVEAKVRAASGVGMALHVFTGNAGAMRFYESMGYGRAGRAEGFYGRGLDALVYRKRFEA